MSPQFTYSQGREIADNCPSQHRAGSWEEFVAVFNAPDYLRSGAKGGRYICGPMRAGQPAGKVAVANWRCNELAAPVAWIAFDFDSLDGPGALDTLIATCRAMFTCLWHHTASSTPQQPRIRVVAPLDRLASPAEVAALAAALGPILGAQRDTNQDRTSQPLYLPLKGAQVMRCDDAPPICVDMWLPAVPVVAPPPPIAQEWTAAPDPAWRGPVDDEELIRRALASKSAASAFGNRASFVDLWNADPVALCRAYPASDRRDGLPYDASSADAALAQMLAFWAGKDCSRIERLMRQSALVRDKWDRQSDPYLERTILGAVGRQFEVFVDEAARRREQIAEAKSIGEGCDDIRLAGTITLEEMLPRFVFIQDGQQVVDLERPQHVALLQDWKSTLKASMTTLEVKGQYNMDGTPKTKTRETSALWEMSPSRQIAQAVTFLAGGKRTVLDPNGRESINTWKAPERSTAPGDPSIFLEHVGYLFGAEAGRFLDWLAHIEQQPGELPQFGWLHISDKQGTGRNWIASIIARLWTGYAAVNFDLAGMFKTGFNDRLSRKLIAVVDEIDQGASTSKHDDAQKLKSLVNEGQRTINPKFGRIREEFNACRWLVFSNHRSALALHDDDRRFNVSRFDGAPRDAAYYKRLYAAMRDPAFIAGVAHMLKTRDLTDFNPGAHAVMNAAKQAVIAANRSETDETLIDLVNRWPADVIQSSTLGELITGIPGGKLTPAHRHALERRGIQSRKTPVKIGNSACRVSILRNADRWEAADPYLIAEELGRGPQIGFGPSGARATLDNLTAA